eukprot:823051-Prymnesium_polylepis.1
MRGERRRTTRSIRSTAVHATCHPVSCALASPLSRRLSPHLSRALHTRQERCPPERLSVREVYAAGRYVIFDRLPPVGTADSAA